MESGSFPDDRIEHNWDPGGRFGELFAKTLNLKGVAWDVYLLYCPDSQWKNDLTAPYCWMHQLGDDKINGAPRLAGAVFESKLKELLN